MDRGRGSTRTDAGAGGGGGSRWQHDQESGRQFRLVRRTAQGPICRQWDDSDGEITGDHPPVGTQHRPAPGRAAAAKVDIPSRPRAQTASQVNASPAASGKQKAGGTSASHGRRQSAPHESSKNSRAEQKQPARQSDTSEESESEGSIRGRTNTLVFAFVPEQEGLDGKILETFVRQSLGAHSTCKFGEYKGRHGFLVQSERALTQDHIHALKAFKDKLRTNAPAPSVRSPSIPGPASPHGNTGHRASLNQTQHRPNLPHPQYAPARPAEETRRFVRMADSGQPGMRPGNRLQTTRQEGRAHVTSSGQREAAVPEAGSSRTAGRGARESRPMAYPVPPTIESTSEGSESEPEKQDRSPPNSSHLVRTTGQQPPNVRRAGTAQRGLLRRGRQSSTSHQPLSTRGIQAPARNPHALRDARTHAKSDTGTDSDSGSDSDRNHRRPRNPPPHHPR